MDTMQVLILDTLNVSSNIINDADISTLSLIKDILLILVAILGAIVAILGLNTWRKQLKGNSEYELARRLLKSIYELREAIQIVRNPLISPEEMVESYKNADASDTNDQLFDSKINIYVYQYRWNDISKSISNLNVDLLEAEVLWGKEIKNLANNILKLVSELRFGIKDFLELGIKGIKEEYGEERVKKVKGLIYKKLDYIEDDEFSGKLTTEIQNIESFLKPYITI
jgi:hypothetical protein